MYRQRSPKPKPPKPKPPIGSARVFAALGDEIRLRIVLRLCDDGPTSITGLSHDFEVTRQAVTKHLRVLERSGLVRGTRYGRESIWELDGRGLNEVRHYLELISKRWDDALGRLRKFVES